MAPWKRCNWQAATSSLGSFFILELFLADSGKVFNFIFIPFSLNGVTVVCFPSVYSVQYFLMEATVGLGHTYRKAPGFPPHS